jgi:hypothetical protein
MAPSIAVWQRGFDLSGLHILSISAVMHTAELSKSTSAGAVQFSTLRLSINNHLFTKKNFGWTVYMV